MSANRQIGWSQESILLQGVSKELERFSGLIWAISAPAIVAPIELNPANSTSWNNGAGNIDSNTSFGMLAFTSNTTGTEDTAYGYKALAANLASFNTAIGVNALMSNTTGIGQVAVGAHVLELSTTNNYNTAVGAYAMARHTSGNNSTAVGTGALFGSTTSTRNTAVGYYAMGGIAGQNMVAPCDINIAVGYQAGGALTTGFRNVLIENITSGTVGVTTGSRNIIIDGVNSCGIITGSNNVIIGGFDNTIADLSNQVIIGTGDGIRRLEFDPTGQMKISNTQPIGAGVATEKLLVRDTATGAVKILDYIVIETTTTSARTATQLTGLYGTAKAGFRAIYTAITPNPIQYTRTASGWLSTTLTNVTG